MSASYAPAPIEDLDGFLYTHPGVTVVDTFDEQCAELAAITGGDASRMATDLGGRTSWYFYPWRGAVVRVLPSAEHELLCGARSRVLIDAASVATLRTRRVGIAGMSVGSRIIEPLAHGPELAEIRCIDPDVVTATSLNRMPVGLADLGTPKVEVGARLVAGVRPWAAVTPIADRLDASNVEAFMDGLDIVVCAMDDPAAKLLLRDTAARLGVDVVMGTDIETGLIDFEPYRTEPAYRPFHGALDEATTDGLRSGALKGPRAIGAIAQIVGLHNLSAEGLSMALALLTGNLASMSQLATTTTMVGGAVARLVHLVLTGHTVNAGRIDLRLDPSLLAGYDTPEAIGARGVLLRQIASLFAPSPAGHQA